MDKVDSLCCLRVDQGWSVGCGGKSAFLLGLALKAASCACCIVLAMVCFPSPFSRIDCVMLEMVWSVFAGWIVLVGVLRLVSVCLCCSHFGAWLLDEWAGLCNVQSAVF